MKFRKKSILTILIAMLAIVMSVITACGQKTDPANGNEPSKSNDSDDKPVTIVLAQPSDPSTLDPHKAAGDQGANVWRNICESLTTYDGQDNLIPYLAKSWEQVSENEWIFHLEEGVKFSNGESFNAEAVGWNLDRGADTDNPRQNMEYRKFYEKGNWEAIDEYTIKITTTKPNFLMPNHMCDLPIIAPAYSTEIGEDAIGSSPVGTGPYMLSTWSADQQITLVKNPNWRGDEPEIDTYIIRTIPEAATRVAELINGNVDILYDLNYEYVDMLKNQANVKFDNKITRRIEYIGFNTTEWTPNPELYDVRVRQAINYAIDRDAIIKNIMGGFSTPVASIWRPDFQDYDPDIKGYDYNPEKAKELLREAGYENGFEIELLTTDGNHAKASEVCEAVAAYLGDVGIKCTVKNYDDATSRSIIINGQDQKLCPGMFDWNWASKPKLYETWLTGIVHSTGMSSYNYIEGYDKLVDDILGSKTIEERTQYIKELQQTLIDNPPYLYLFQLGSIYVTTERLDWSPSGTQFILAKEMKISR